MSKARRAAAAATIAPATERLRTITPRLAKRAFRLSYLKVPAIGVAHGPPRGLGGFAERSVFISPLAKRDASMTSPSARSTPDRPRPRLLGLCGAQMPPRHSLGGIV